MRVLVTGGAGYIGSHTVKALKDAGHYPVVLDNLVYGHENVVKNILQVPLIVDQVGNREILKQILLGKHEALINTTHENKPVEAVLHFAAYAYVAESVEKPLKYYRNNVIESTILLETLCDPDITQHTNNNLPIPIVFSSTCATYGTPKDVPITENTPQAPINPYGRSKFFIENIIKDLSYSSGLQSVILRYFNAAGAMPDSSLGESHEPETHLIPLVIQAALGVRKNIKIFGNDYDTPDGTCIRDYIHVCDLADAHVKALDLFSRNEVSQNNRSSKSDSRCFVFNLGNGNGVSVKEVITTVIEITGKKINIVNSPRRPGDPAILIASSKKIKSVLGWQPKYPSIAQIVKDAYRWHKKNHEKT